MQFTNLPTAPRRLVFFNSLNRFHLVLGWLFASWDIVVVFYWSIQVSLYKGGEQTGPAKFTWPNGAVREGSKVSTPRKLNLLEVSI